MTRFFQGVLVGLILTGLTIGLWFHFSSGTGWIGILTIMLTWVLIVVTAATARDR